MSAFISRALLCCSLLCISFLYLALMPVRKLAHSTDALAQKPTGTATERQGERRRMVEEQIRARGIASERVLQAMRKVPRHRFLPESLAHLAYSDRPLPIGLDQTISQPFIVAYMTDAAGISPQEKVLEIGTGSGYQAAILGELAKAVYTIEIIPELGERARSTLAEMGYQNIHVRIGNGYEGWAEHAPYDVIIVTAAPEAVPPALIDQLAVDGRMVIPVGAEHQQMLVIRKTRQGIVTRRTLPVRFVPMTGKPPK